MKFDLNLIFKFKIILFLAILMSVIPLINIPFRWVTVFFHEISHGLVAIATGGEIDKINLHILGSGLCYTIGGSKFFISLSGYLGAIIWGVIIYLLADEVKAKNIHFLIYGILALIAVSFLFWARDIITWAILAVIFAFFASLIKFQGNYLIKFFLKFIGVYILLDAAKSPLYLFDGRHYGDGANLADATGIPEIFWVIIWFFAGISAIYYLSKSDQNTEISQRLKQTNLHAKNQVR